MYKFFLLVLLAACTNTNTDIPDIKYPEKPIPEKARVDSVVLVYGENGILKYDQNAIAIMDTTDYDFKIIEYRLKNNRVIDTNNFVWIYEFKGQIELPIPD